MRKFLIRWWLTADWQRECLERTVIIWNDSSPLAVAAERHASFFGDGGYLDAELAMGLNRGHVNSRLAIDRRRP